MLKPGTKVLVYSSKYRISGDIGVVKCRDADDHRSYLVESILDKEFSFWVDKSSLLELTFTKPNFLQRLKFILGLQ